jgi:serine/threonine protein phosphatase PrpC
MIAYDGFAISESGPSGLENEDFVVLDAQRGVFIVADGLGGRPGGAIASKIAAEAFLRAASADRDPIRAASAAHVAVRAASGQDVTLKGMATTLTAAVLTDGRGFIAHVGDSRAYKFSRGRLEQITRDHSVVAELVARAHISQEGARHHPLRGMLTRTVGTDADFEVDVEEIILAADDYLLLSTDGVHKTLTDERLEELIIATRGQTAQAVCSAIISEALAMKPSDNTTLLVVRLKEE